MSNRLTFSLASLILIFALAFVAMPAMAADGGPTVTIGNITGNRVAVPGDTPPKTGITVEVTYSVPVTITEVEAADLKHTLQNGAGATIGTAGSDATSVATIPATLPGSPLQHNKFLFTLPDITDTSARKVVVWVVADSATGLTPGGTAGPASQASAFKTHTLPSVLPFTAELTAAQKKDANDADIAGRFTVTLTLKKADDSAPTSAEVTPAPTIADIMIEPMGAATAVDAAGAAITVTTTALPDGTVDDGIYTQDYQLGFGFSTPESVTLSLTSGYMGNVPSLKLPPVPPADPVYQNPPTVMLEVVSHDAASRSFQISVSTTPAADTEGAAGKAIKGQAIKDELKIKDGSTPAADVSVMLLDGETGNERIADNSYRAILEYGPFDTLPLTVSIDPNDLSDNADATDVDPVMGMVGEAATGDPTTGDPTATAPEKPAPPVAAIDATNDLIINVTWTAPADNGSAITGYTLEKYEGTTLVKTFPETGQPAIAAAPTAAAPYVVGPVPAADRGKTFTFKVIATNAGGDSAKSDSSNMVTIMHEAPSAPTLVATPGIEKAILTWTHADAPAGAMYEYTRDNGTTWHDAPASPHEVTGLMGDTPYTFQLRVKASPATNMPAGASSTAFTVTPMPGFNLAPEFRGFSIYSSNSTSVVFAAVFSEPMADHQTSISRFEETDLTVTDHDGTPITGYSVSWPGVPTGTTSLTYAGTEEERYLVTVPLSGIPDARPLVAGMQLEVHVELDPDGVLDGFGNPVEQPLNQVGLLMTMYDTIPPMVLSHTSQAMTDPTGLPPGDYVEFTFVFDEPIDTMTFGPDSIDQGSSHNVGNIHESHFNLMKATGATDDSYTLLVPIVDTGDDTTVVLKVGNNALEDMHGNALETSYIGTHPATGNTAPVFIRPHANAWSWCEAERKRDEDGNLVEILLPKARDEEGDGLTYALLDASGNPALSDDPVSNGLYWITIDSETRHLLGKAKTTDAGTYTWRVTDEHGATDSTTLTLTVTPYAKPNKVTDVAATKVDGKAKIGAGVDKVTLTWTDSNPTDPNTDYPNDDCIPVVTEYIISIQELNTYDMGRTPKGAAVTKTVSIADATTTGNNREYTTEKLAHGTYEFTVQAVNAGGNSVASDEAIWDRTGYHWIIVDDPPMASTNLRANQTDEGAHSVTLEWKPHEPDNSDAPVDDTAPGLAMKLYGVEKNFGGYHLEVTDQRSPDVAIYPEDYGADADKDPDNLIRGNERTFHLAGLPVGEYTVRVVASNIVGEGALSDTQEFEIDVYQPGDTENTAPVFADGASIASIVATVDERVPGRFLPEATDADGDDLTYSIEDADGMATTTPGGLTFNPSNRALTGTPTAVMEETAYTYKVSDGTATDTIGFFISVKSAVAGPPATSTPVTSIPAQGFIVYVRDIDNPPHFGTSNPMVAEWAAMPNLYEFFTQGGGGSLQLNVTGVTARQVVFNEVMWAVDLGKVGQASYDGNQWIELRNRTDNAINISDISFVVKNARPALAEGTDLISNVVGGGNAWIRTKGQNGNSGAADGSGQVEFISMRRSKYDAGWNGGHWTAATQVYHPNHKGTPGKDEPQGVRTFPASGVALNTIFNEIGNYPSGNSDHEWIELRIKNGDPHFENYVVDMVTGASDRDITTDPKQERLFKMPKLNTGRYDNILLITKTDPYRDDSHPLRGGYNVEVDFAQQKNEGRDSNIRYYVADDWNTDLPDNGEFVLILRHNQDRTNHERVEDLAGYHPNLKKETADFFTNLWPLIGYPAPNLTNNKIAAGQIDRRAFDDIPGTRTKDGNKVDKVAFRSDNNGWTGVGYKRNANAGAQNGGTPGYPNNALTSAETLAGDANPVVISEIMYATGERGNLPQWVELRNTSKTSGINLDGWQLRCCEP